MRTSRILFHALFGPEDQTRMHEQYPRHVKLLFFRSSIVIGIISANLSTCFGVPWAYKQTGNKVVKKSPLRNKVALKRGVTKR